jgi:hypothetical protein
MARRSARSGRPGDTPQALARLAYYNGMSAAQRRLAGQLRGTDSSRIIGEPVSRRDLPAALPRTWILTERDRALSVAAQRRGIAALGGVQTVIPVRSCHMLMLTEPKLLAEIMIDRCRRYC